MSPKLFTSVPANPSTYISRSSFVSQINDTMRCVSLLLLFLTGDHTASAVRSSKTSAEDEGKICIGCGKYPEAPDYEDNWLTEGGLQASAERMKRLQEELESASESMSGEEAEAKAKMQELIMVWQMAMHTIFEMLQGQMCRDMCAICLPSQDDLAKSAKKQEDPALRTVHMTRGKNWQNASLSTVVAPIDTVAGGVAGLLVGLPLAVASFFAGGGIGGAVVGTATSAFVTNKTHSSLAGGALGMVAGLTTGVVAGSSLAALTELLGLAMGMWKGIGLTAALTDCKRVGFERFVNGMDADPGKYAEKPFTSKTMSNKYGLKRLRAWMKDNADWKNNMALQEIAPRDEERVRHCERVREHSFDMRHATECFSHSQFCPNGAVVVPVSSASTCKAFSNVEWLEKLAVQFGDDPDKGMFAQWRKMQADIRQQSGFDGKKLQCVKTLCEYGGFRRAGLKLHPDRVKFKKDITEEEKDRLTNLFSFLSGCKQDYELQLDDKEEREAACSALEQAGLSNA
eukprot:TRINITY_DN120973_c0_g1_i1.p1 TRINITY_DN120973_c0_g1~~TRINITY_DN120973_c0_g1_i1.p1  ORF type:complete len:524 (+),score=92.88 TRINITY_DN120973_c0_g1_i1:32-1573(+)